MISDYVLTEAYNLGLYASGSKDKLFFYEFLESKTAMFP